MQPIILIWDPLSIKLFNQFKVTDFQNELLTGIYSSRIRKMLKLYPLELILSRRNPNYRESDSTHHLID